MFFIELCGNYYIRYGLTSPRNLHRCASWLCFMSETSGRPSVSRGIRSIAWWRHQMDTLSASLAIYAGNSPVTGEFPAQRPVTRSLMFSLICAWINGWVNNNETCDLRRHRAHYDVIVVVNHDLRSTPRIKMPAVKISKLWFIFALRWLACPCDMILHDFSPINTTGVTHTYQHKSKHGWVITCPGKVWGETTYIHSQTSTVIPFNFLND